MAFPLVETFAEGRYPVLTLGERSSYRRTTGLWLPGCLRLGPLYKAMVDFQVPRRLASAPPEPENLSPGSKFCEKIQCFIIKYVGAT